MISALSSTKTTTRYLLIAALLFCTASSLSFAQTEKIDLHLIEVHELLQQPSEWIVLDTRPVKNWKAGHIPEAISFSWHDYTRQTETEIKNSLIPAEDIALALGEMGIDEHTPLVVYGDADTSEGGEGWACWVLSWLGHKGPIRLLQGGIQAWQTEEIKLSQHMDNSPSETKYHINLREELNISADNLKSNLDKVVLVDTRSIFEWIWNRLPDAVHLPWNSLHHGNEHRLIAPMEYQSLMRKHDVDPDQKVVFYCSAGIRSAYAWTAHRLSGYSNAVNFTGGMEEWEKYLKETQTEH